MTPKINRFAKIERNTKETQIAVELNLDGNGFYEVSTGIGFLDHMLEQLSRHSLIDLKVKIKGEIKLDLDTEEKTNELKINAKGETDAEGNARLEFKRRV